MVQKFRFLPLFMVIILALDLACQKESDPEITENVFHFSPLEPGSYWIYEVQTVDENDQEQEVRTEKWSVDSCCYLVNIYDITDSSALIGFRSFRGSDTLWLFDPVDKFLTVNYLNLPADSILLIASGNSPAPYEHYIYGGLKEISTEFGFRDCICTKTIFNPGSANQEVWYKFFTKGIGKIAQENRYYDDASPTAEPISKKFWTLKEYHLE